jgi:hypothetical protein
MFLLHIAERIGLMAGIYGAYLVFGTILLIVVAFCWRENWKDRHGR